MANFYLGVNKKTKFALLNDINSEVYSLLICIKNNKLLNQLVSIVKKLQPIEKEDYYYWKSLEPTDELEKAIKLLVILNCSPNGAGGGYSNEKAHRQWYTNKIPIWKKINQLFQNVRITNFDYTDVLEEIITGKTKADFLYLDPPYFKVAEKGNLYRNYNFIDWKTFKSYLGKIDSQWILSNRDCIEVREMFSEYYQKSYNTYNDMNNQKNKNPEIIISNYKIKSFQI